MRDGPAEELLDGDEEVRLHAGAPEAGAAPDEDRTPTSRELLRLVAAAARELAARRPS